MSRRCGQVAALVVLVLGALALLAPTVGAHAVLVESVPVADGVVQDPPERVVLRFDEPVRATSEAIAVLDPGGAELDGLAATVSSDTVASDLPALDLDGSYTVTWSVVSSDGHPIRGTFLFHLRERTLSEPAETVGEGAPLAASVLRAGGAVAALAGLVLVLASWFRDRRHPARWLPVVAGTLVSLVGAVVAVGDSLGASWEVVVATSSGRMNLVAVGLALLGATTTRSEGTAELVVASALVVAVAAQGHAVGIAPIPRSAGLTVAHVAAAVAWGVALVVLDTRARRSEEHGSDSVAAAVRRWSPWGMAAVVALAATGAALVWDRVGPDQLLGSTYGRVSLVKVALLVVAVVVAARNRWRLAGDPDRLARSVRIEVVVLALALVAGAALAQVRPPDGSDTGGAGGAFEQRLAFGDGQVELTIEPGRRGTNEMHITATGADGRLMAEVDDLRLELSLPAADVGPLEPEMIPITSGHAMSYAEIPLAGTWTIEVISRPTKFEEYRATFEVPVAE